MLLCNKWKNLEKLLQKDFGLQLTTEELIAFFSKQQNNSFFSLRQKVFL